MATVQIDLLKTAPESSAVYTEPGEAITYSGVRFVYDTSMELEEIVAAMEKIKLLILNRGY